MTTNRQLPHPALNHIPPQVLCAQDYEDLARHFIEAASLAYIAGGSGEEQTLRNNRAAFDTYALLPRVLRDLREGHTRRSVLGMALLHPILLAPLAYQQLVHPLGERETARAAAATDTCMIVSTLASTTLEEIAQHAGELRWFQLYFQAQRKDTLHLLERAQAAGYRALVVTLDATIQVPSHQAQRAGFRMPATLVAANLPCRQADNKQPLSKGQSRIFQGLLQQAPRLEDLQWLLAQTSLPVLVKGVLHPDDARWLRELGVAGIVVSNHGGRSLDGVPASLTQLPTLRAAVGETFPLLFDGGIRSGSDIFKALALGADAVLIGRLQMYALSVAGALGVGHLLRLLREELEVCMALCGCATLQDVNSRCLMEVKPKC